jgi:toxin ParE1/3/4
MTKPGRGKRKVVLSIEWTERALADLRAIDHYIAADDPVAAERWTGRLIAKAEAAARLPMAGRMVPEKRRPDIREVFLRT